MKDERGMTAGTIVDMDNYTVDEKLAELHKRRFGMQPAVIAAFRQAGQIGAQRLLDLVNDKARFDKLPVRSQVEVLNLIFDRAYGRTETASSAELANQKLGGGAGDKSDHTAQLDAIAERARKRAALGVAGSSIRADTDESIFPELKNKQRAVVPFRRQE